MRLIDADFAEDLLLAHEQNAKAMGKTEYAKGIRTAYADVSICRTITDAVKVVRCRDCRDYQQDTIFDRNNCRRFPTLPITKDFFCPYGERKDDDSNL